MLHTRIDKGVYPFAEAACCGVEINTAEIIADRVDLIAAPGGTEIERTAVGGEDGIGLKDRVPFEQGREQQFVFLDVVDLEVGGLIEDLDTVTVGIMEQLTGSVGGISNIAARGPTN